MELSKEGVVL